MEKYKNAKTKWLLGMGLFLLACITAVILSVFNTLFPKAEPIQLPEMEELLSLTLSSTASDEIISLDTADAPTLFAYFSQSKSTRRQAIDDLPTEKVYYTLSARTARREYRYFIYEKSGQTYVEAPYEGIYEAQTELLHFLSAF